MIEDGTFGPLNAYQAWGVVSAVIYLAALYLVARRAGLGVRDTLVVSAVALLALYVGSRLFFELVEFPLMPGRMWVRVPPLLARLPSPLGFTFLGGLALLAVLAAVLGLTPLVAPGPGRILDVLAAPTALGFTASKAGCILAGCCYGRPTDGWLHVTMSHLHTSAIEPTVPVRFLEMGVGLVLAALALLLLERPPAALRLRDGTIFAGFALLASLARFGSGYLRGDYEVVLGPLHAVQWGALAIAAIAGGSLAFLVATRVRA
jgi:phosphatidylglycerol:prolipoprotein diacylglycerol transferase